MKSNLQEVVDGSEMMADEELDKYFFEEIFTVAENFKNEQCVMKLPLSRIQVMFEETKRCIFQLYSFLEPKLRE